jgi:hypothetical protein
MDQYRNLFYKEIYSRNLSDIKEGDFLYRLNNKGRAVHVAVVLRDNSGELVVFEASDFGEITGFGKIGRLVDILGRSKWKIYRDMGNTDSKNVLESHDTEGFPIGATIRDPWTGKAANPYFEDE